LSGGGGGGIVFPERIRYLSTDAIYINFDIILKFHTIAMLVTVELQIIFIQKL